MERALGCMRLPDEAAARAVVHAALEAGVTLLDTANVYGPEGAGENERWIARALADWTGPRPRVATKGGLTRPGGRWVPDGRAKAIRAACEGSLEALGVDAIDLYQLHAPDPRTPWKTTCRALAKLKAEGLVRSIGLCNVSVAQLREAQGHVEVDAVQIALSPFEESGLRSGLPQLCRAEGLTLLAHSPFGGPKRAARIGRHAGLREVAERHGVSPWSVALAWLEELGAIPLPGCTRPETAAALAGTPSLTEADRATLDAAFPLGARVREPPVAPSPDTDGEVVLLMGMPGAGKSTLAEPLLRRGYLRLNRDEVGGTLKKLHRRLDERLGEGARRVVLDNTYGTRALRDQVIEIAWRHGLPVRCVFVDTPLEEAQINACLRMIARRGRLLEPDEMKRAGKEDPNLFDPRVQLRFRDALEPPSEDEGFSALERIPFARRPFGGDEPAVLVSLDAFARFDGDAAILDEARAATLRAEPRLLVATGWAPKASAASVEARARSLEEALERPVDVRLCRHAAGPPICWCRKPLPGLGVAAILAHGLDPARSLWVGTSAADRTLAGRLGVPHTEADTYFAAR
ncbi:MAG: aldo/keto reductase [Myxococcota bacterium]|nr:aldo/keto reductase [Myxococcota bacterium]